MNQRISSRPGWQSPRALIPAITFCGVVLLYLSSGSGTPKSPSSMSRGPPRPFDMWRDRPTKPDSPAYPVMPAKPQPPAQPQQPKPPANVLPVAPVELMGDVWASHNYLTGNLTESFKTNLKDNHKYITGFLGGGWTNDFMTIANMMYLGLLTQRVPVIPPFMPLHIGYDNPTLPFSEIFDLPRFRAASNSPALEWSEVKKFPIANAEVASKSDQKVELLGGWSVYMGTGPEGTPRWSGLVDVLRLDMSWTAVPKIVRLPSAVDHAGFDYLAMLAFPEFRAKTLAEAPPLPSLILHATALPDDQLMCLDYLYFVSSAQSFEWFKDYSPVWRFVAVHLRWTPRIEDLAWQYLARTFDVGEKSHVPPFISVHVRRADFKTLCNSNVPIEKCFPSLSKYEQLVKRIQQELLKTKGIDATQVVVTSDETDPKWWAEAFAMGWKRIDHAGERTIAKYGKWYEPILDSVILSLGAGCVGTKDSTMSFVAGRRVQDWNNGIYAEVQRR